MDRNGDFRKSSEENAELLPEENAAEESALSISVPESYYHNINDAPEENKDRYYEIFDEKNPKSRIWSLVSVILAIASVICSFFGWAGLIVGVTAVILAAVSRLNLGYFDNMAIGGLITGIFGSVFGTVMAIVSMLL